MKILIAGFIGYQLVKKLLEHGIDALGCAASRNANPWHSPL